MFHLAYVIAQACAPGLKKGKFLLTFLILLGKCGSVWVHTRISGQQTDFKIFGTSYSKLEPHSVHVIEISGLNAHAALIMWIGLSLLAMHLFLLFGGKKEFGEAMMRTIINDLTKQLTGRKIQTK